MRTWSERRRSTRIRYWGSSKSIDFWRKASPNVSSSSVTLSFWRRAREDDLFCYPQHLDSDDIRYATSTIILILFSSIIFSYTQPNRSAWYCSSTRAALTISSLPASYSIISVAAIVLFSHTVIVSSPISFQLSDNAISLWKCSDVYDMLGGCSVNVGWRSMTYFLPKIFNSGTTCRLYLSWYVEFSSLQNSMVSVGRNV